ncbi:conserved hypothetical protein [Clostridioides difficile CD002]|uniref:bacteriophage abortive infection AbiH family protein n=1 Tax=Clostridioides difficile TaxID=1496 RepID=UPI0003B2959F|nr:bacteriophage abortive infection AbiH family protein [Clostridioides difficile]CCL08518.1 conserved hypothetical protein [Clostridioides difficile CD002]
MGNLFIIGNGFDLAHGLSTRYEDFHQYLKLVNHSEVSKPESRNVIKFLIDVVDDAEKFDGYIDDYKWTDFESSLNFLDFTNYLQSFDRYYEIYGFNYNEYIYEDFYELDSNIEYNGLLACISPEAELLDYKIDYRNNKEIIEDVEHALHQENEISILNEKEALKILEYCSYLHKYFYEWINTIQIDKKVKRKIDFYNLINSNDSIFINFNYTKTLELLYEVNSSKIFHIHGIQGGNIVLGHGDEEMEIDYSIYVGSEYILESVYESLKKDTNKVIVENENFFDSLVEKIDKIYSFGFSFSEVDLIYIRKICKTIETKDIIWYINDFDKNKNYRAIIKGCGFKGKFSTFVVRK